MSQQPFDDIRALLADLPAAGEAEVASDIGRLAPIAAWIAAWRGRAEVNRPILALYAGAHQGMGQGEDARARLEAIAAGHAPVARAAAHLGAGLDVFDLAVDRPVPDIVAGPAMSERECAATMAFGMEALAKQPDLLLLGGFGPGTRDAAEALIVALIGGVDTLARARAAAARGQAEAGGDGLQLMRQLGGRETAALAGAILAARTQRVPVLLDGVSAVAASAALAAVDRQAIAHCRLARPHPAAAGLGLTAITDLELGLDDGAGAMAALGLVRLACAMAEAPPI